MGLFAASEAREMRGPLMRFVPTRADFGVPHLVSAVRPVAHGDLRCTSSALDDCVVANMPLLFQMDQRLLAPLEAYSARYEVKRGPDFGRIIWAEPQYNIAPTAYTPADFASNIMGYGCYITALTTLEEAAFANQNGAPTARARTLAQIDAGDLMPGGAPINRLEWQYRRWADKLQPNLADPSDPSSPDFLQLEEFAGDFPSGSVAYRDYPNPGELSAASLINGMKAGATYLIAFQRYNVTIASGRGGPVTLALTYDSHHKVAVSGFQPGPYPILINDVGNGKRYRVRLTTDIHSIPFSETISGGSYVIPPGQIMIDIPTTSPVPFPAPPRLYLLYEGADNVAVGNGGQLFVIEDIQALTIASPHPASAPRGGRGRA
jgi:hypothetical protein